MAAKRPTRRLSAGRAAGSQKTTTPARPAASAVRRPPATVVVRDPDGGGYAAKADPNDLPKVLVYGGLAYLAVNHVLPWAAGKVMEAWWPTPTMPTLPPVPTFLPPDTNYMYDADDVVEAEATQEQPEPEPYPPHPASAFMPRRPR